MIENINLPLILVAHFMASASPGPATLAISGASMAQGRHFGLAMAFGITTGSIIWSASAAFGLGAIMQANAWVFEILRYVGAGYLIFLAYKSARSAFSSKEIKAKKVEVSSLKQAYIKGLMLHLTNPKAILFFGALFAIVIPHGTTPTSLALVVVAMALQSLIIFHGYAFVFSSAIMVAGYIKLRRWFETIFAIGFGVAGFKILTVKLD